MNRINQLMDLSGRKALITGGSGHIGLVVAQSLLELGAQVAIFDRDEELCERRVNELKNVGSVSVFACPCNLNEEQDIRRAMRKILGQFGGLDIFVHCAALVGANKYPGWAVPFEKQTVQAWNAAMQVNVTSAFIIVQECQKMLGAHNRGSVIFFGSIYGMVGPDMRLYHDVDMANPIAYGVSKGGLLQLMRYFSTLLAPSIRINTISLGGVSRSQPSSFQEEYISRTPLGRMATEEDVKGAVAYLASDLSSYVTGHNLVVDGGWTAW